jgi:hypothetical protein
VRGRDRARPRRQTAQVDADVRRRPVLAHRDLGALRQRINSELVGVEVG